MRDDIISIIQLVGFPSGQIIEITEVELYELLDKKLISDARNISRYILLHKIKYIFQDNQYDNIIKFLIP